MSSLTELQSLLHEKYDIDVATLTPDASITEYGLDSLAIAEFMFAVEDHFHITLPDDDPTIDTLGKLAALVDQVKAAQAAAPPVVPVVVASASSLASPAAPVTAPVTAPAPTAAEDR